MGPFQRIPAFVLVCLCGVKQRNPLSNLMRSHEKKLLEVRGEGYEIRDEG